MRTNKKDNSKRGKKIRNKTNIQKTASYAVHVRPNFGPFPKAIWVEMDYHENITLSAMLTTTLSVYVFRLNSIFDPNKTGTGTQPYGHDSYALNYNRYRVDSVKYRINVSAADILNFAVVPLNGTSGCSTTAEFDIICEAPWSKNRVIGYSGNGGSRSISGVVSLPTLTSLPNIYKTDDRFAAIFGNNPTEVIDLVLGFYNTSMSTQSPRITVDLKYRVLITDPLVQTESYRRALVAKQNMVNTNSLFRRKST
jgi:hypothetical protein